MPSRVPGSFLERFFSMRVRPLVLVCALFVVIALGIMSINSVKESANELQERVTDLRIQRDQSVFPMVAPGRALTEVIGAIDADADGVRIIQSEADIKQREGASDER